jgi:hypothetical protein
MDKTTNASPAETPNLSRVAEDALDAFWDVVVENYPLAKTGDMSPAMTDALEAAASKAVEEWVKNNASAA